VCDIPHDTVKINPIVCSVISSFPTVIQRFIESITNSMFGKSGVGGWGGGGCVLKEVL
jgi:hypothetical protein